MSTPATCSVKVRSVIVRSCIFSRPNMVWKMAVIRETWQKRTSQTVNQCTSAFLEILYWLFLEFVRAFLTFTDDNNYPDNDLYNSDAFDLTRFQPVAFAQVSLEVWQRHRRHTFATLLLQISIIFSRFGALFGHAYLFIRSVNQTCVKRRRCKRERRPFVENTEAWMERCDSAAARSWSLV